MISLSPHVDCNDHTPLAFLSFIQFLWNKWEKNKTKIHWPTVIEQWVPFPPMHSAYLKQYMSIRYMLDYLNIGNERQIWVMYSWCWGSWLRIINESEDKHSNKFPESAGLWSSLVHKMLAFWFRSFSPSALMKCTVLLLGNYVWWVCHKMWFLWECCTSPWKKALHCQTWFDCIHKTL